MRVFPILFFWCVLAVIAEPITQKQMDELVRDKIRNQILSGLANSQHEGCFTVLQQSLGTYQSVLDVDLPPAGYVYSVDTAYAGGGFGDVGLNPMRICVMLARKKR